MVGNNQEEEQYNQYNQYNQSYEPNNTQNLRFEQPTNKIPQSVYQSTSGPANAYKNRYNQADSQYGYNHHVGENELPGFSEQILSSHGGQPAYAANQSASHPNMMPNATQESMNFNKYQVDPKQSMYNQNMASMNLPPGGMYPNQFQHSPPSQQLFGANTFGNDQNMSMYAQPQQQMPGQMSDNFNSLNDPYLGGHKGEAEFLNEKLTKVQQMYDTLKKEYDEQKSFYDEALEARTNQLEEAENETQRTKGEFELSKKAEIDLKAKNESLKFDNEMLNKRIENTSQDKTNASQREEGLLTQLDELNTALKQKESIIEQKVDENFGLKQTLDQMKNEAEKVGRRIDTLEDLLRNKDAEISDYEKAIESFKGEINAMTNKEKGLIRENESLSNDLNSVKQQLHSEKERSEHILRDVNNLKEALSQSQNREQSSRNAHESAKKEVEAIKTQLSQANSYIQNQDNQFRTLQRDYDNMKSNNMEIKSLLEQEKMKASYAQQQMQYQPPPTQYIAPPKYESNSYHQPPPQFNYSPPTSQEQAYPPPPAYKPSSDYNADYGHSTPPRSNKNWEQESHSQYSEQHSYHSPPKEDYKHAPRSQYSDNAGDKYTSQSQSMGYNASHQNVDQAFGGKSQHNQSSMGSLLTWEAKENQNKPHLQHQTRAPAAVVEDSYQPQSRGLDNSVHEKKSQWFGFMNNI